jgi:hypothetical protein
MIRNYMTRDTDCAGVDVSLFGPYVKFLCSTPEEAKRIQAIIDEAAKQDEPDQDS